jgi:U3 small nucleolar RNA-associated protein MPP10
MDEGQIWEQLDLRARTVCETLKEALDGRWNEEEDGEGEEGEMLKKAMMMIDYVDNEDEEDMDLDELMEQKDMNSEDGDDDDDDDIEESDDDEDQESGKDDGEDEEFGESVEVLRDPSSDEDNEEFYSPSSLLDKRARKASSLKKRKFSELDDDFFDLSLFNAETEEAESLYVSKGSLGRAEDDEDDQDVQEFVDLFLPVDEPENLNEENLQYKGMMVAPIYYCYLSSDLYRGLL